MINSIHRHLLHIHPPPFLLLPVSLSSVYLGGWRGEKLKVSWIGGGVPEGTGVCSEMSAHFRIHLRFGTLTHIADVYLHTKKS